MDKKLEKMFSDAAMAKSKARDMMLDFIKQFVEGEGGRYEFKTNPLIFPTMHGGNDVAISAVEIFEGNVYLCSPYVPVGAVKPKEAKYRLYQLCGRVDDMVAMKFLEEN